MIRRALFILFAACVLIAPLSASAAGPAYSKAYQACMAKAESTVAMDDCNKGELNRRTPLLNRAFQGALGRVGAQLQPQVRTAERAWIALRDADCGLYEDREEFGSFGVIEAGQCIIEHTIERTKTLEGFAPSMAGPGE